ncbi:MFS transporter [Longispora sp. K20-0274]|uniref:MFS transporter n=1 Tax=Longispora sp. K20-0274 TaxID=3088255 RepID=UPI00399A3625
MAAPTARVNPWLALLVLCVGNFLILLDTSIVNTAAPDIMSSLDTGIDKILWVLNGYLLALASLLIVFGRLGDLFGPRKVFVAGLGLFAVASVLCGVSQTPDQLIAARVVQGIGAAALLPQALVLISAIFPAERRGAAFGVFTAVAGIAAVSGPTLGGLLVTELGWQWIFYVNVPLALGGIVAALRLIPDLRSGRPHRFDPVGVALATGGLIGLVYGLVEGQRHHWGRVAGPVTIPLILGAAVVLLVLFVLWERRQAEPLLPLGLFRDRNFAIATVLTLVTSFALFGFLLVFVLETQTLLGMSPWRSGLTALPWTVALSAVAPVAGRLTDRIGGRLLLVVGLALYAAGVLGVALIPTGTSTWVTFALPLVVVGLGMGTAIAPTTTEAMRSIAPERAGAASGVLNTARQVGAALGAAVIGAVLQNRFVAATHVVAREEAGRLPAEYRDRFVGGFDEAATRGLQLGSGQHGGVAQPADLPPGLADGYRHLVADTFGAGFLQATRPTLIVVAGVLALGSLLAAFMARRPAPVSARAAEPVGTRAGRGR